MKSKVVYGVIKPVLRELASNIRFKEWKKKQNVLLFECIVIHKTILRLETCFFSSKLFFLSEIIHYILENNVKESNDETHVNKTPLRIAVIQEKQI